MVLSSSSLSLRVCLDAPQLATPVPGEHPAPVTDGAKCLCVCSIQRPPAVAPHGDQTNLAQHLQVLRDRRLPQLERVGDLADRSLLERNELQDVPAARFGYRVEGIRSRRGARHRQVIYSYIGMCQVVFRTLGKRTAPLAPASRGPGGAGWGGRHGPPRRCALACPPVGDAAGPGDVGALDSETANGRDAGVYGAGTVYAAAGAALVAAVVLRWLLDPLMGNTLPLVTLFGAVAATVWIGGYRPAILVGALGYLACDYLFIPPRGQLGIFDIGHVVGLL